MRKLIKDCCALATKDELKCIEVRLLGASLGVFVADSLVLEKSLGVK